MVYVFAIGMLYQNIYSKITIYLFLLSHTYRIIPSTQGFYFRTILLPLFGLRVNWYYLIRLVRSLNITR